MAENVVILAIPEFGLRKNFYDMLKVEGVVTIVGVRNWGDLMKKLATLPALPILSLLPHSPNASA